MSEASRRRQTDITTENLFRLGVSTALKAYGLLVTDDKVSVKISGSVAADNEVAAVTARVPTVAQANRLKDAVAVHNSVFWTTLQDELQDSYTVSKSGEAQIIHVQFVPPALPAPPAPPSSNNQTVALGGENNQSTLDAGAISGIVIGALAGVCLCAGGAYLARLKMQKNKANRAMHEEITRGDEATLVQGQGEAGELTRPSDATEAPPLQATFVQK